MLKMSTLLSELEAVTTLDEQRVIEGKISALTRVIDSITRSMCVLIETRDRVHGDAIPSLEDDSNILDTWIVKMENQLASFQV